MANENLSSLVPGHSLNIEELSQIRGGAEITEQETLQRVCDTGACSSNLEALTQYCSNSICRTGA